MHLLRNRSNVSVVDLVQPQRLKPGNPVASPQEQKKKNQEGGGGGGREEERNCHDKNCAAKCILIIFNSLVIYFCLIVQGLLTVGFLFQRSTCHSLCFCRLHSTLVLLYSLFADTVEMYLPPTCNPKRNCTCKLCNCRR